MRRTVRVRINYDKIEIAIFGKVGLSNTGGVARADNGLRCAPAIPVPDSDLQGSEYGHFIIGVEQVAPFSMLSAYDLSWLPAHADSGASLSGL